MQNPGYWYGLIPVAIVVVRLARLPWTRRLYHKYRNREWSTKIKKLERQRQYQDIAEKYRKSAAKQQTNYLRENDLGLAALYEHDAESAIRHLKDIHRVATGSNAITIASNLALAYLQAGRVDKAYEILEELREKDYVIVFTYVLTLLLLNQKQDAASMFTQYGEPSKDPVKIDALRTSLAFDPHVPETLNSVEALLDNPELWLYKPVFEQLIMKWKLEVFAVQVNRYEVLSEQAFSLLQMLEQESSLFSSAKLRFMRSALSVVAPRVGSYDGVASLYGVVIGLDDFSKTLPIEERLRAELVLFWSRVYLLFLRTTSFEKYHHSGESNLLRSFLPADANCVFSQSERCALYMCPSIDSAIRKEKVSREGYSPLWIDIVPDKQFSDSLPFLRVIEEAIREFPKDASPLEDLAFHLICYPDAVTPSRVNETLTMLSVTLRTKLSGLVEEFNAKLGRTDT